MPGLKRGKLFELPAEYRRCLYLPAYPGQIEVYGGAKAAELRLEQSWPRLQFAILVPASLHSSIEV